MKKAILGCVGKRQTMGARVGVAFWGLALPLCAAFGCEGQVGEGYTGEPLLSLQGTVILTEPRSGDLVPALAFHFGKYTLIDPEVRGTFPAEVRLDVMETPPESALFTVVDPNFKGKIGFAKIVVVPRDHPRVVTVGYKPSSECIADGSVCVREEERCSDDGRCKQRTLECVVEDCPIVSQTGDASIAEEMEAPGRTGGAECLTDSCMTALQVCRAGNDCYREIRECDLNRTSATTGIAGSGVPATALARFAPSLFYEVCRITGESGDASLSAFEHLEEVALGYTIYYLTEENTLPGLGTLGPGYHLIEMIQPSDQEWVAQINCEYQAAISAVERYNQDHGTSYVAHEPIEDTSVSDAISAEQERLKSECPKAVTRRVLETPLDHHLTFKLARAPRDNGF